jgi:tetratricopeptide (TPR) repeat protein
VVADRNVMIDNSARHSRRPRAIPPEPYVAHPYTLLPKLSRFVGRQEALGRLTEWVSDSRSDAHTARVLSIVAMGGMGKSAVAWTWFNDVAPVVMDPLCGRIWWSFYSADAGFDHFVSRALGYVTRRTAEEIAVIPAAEREEQLLAVLDTEPHLIVLDGVERLLLAHVGPDADGLADDDADMRAAGRDTGLLGLPQSAATSFIGQSRLRAAADPRVGAFLRRLATAGAARVLITSRLYPADLQIESGEPLPGTHAYFLDGLTDDDSVALWRAFGVGGDTADLIALFRTFGNYPLLIRALAGEVRRFAQAPGDLAAWRATHPDFDPLSLPEPMRHSHVLRYAFSGLSPLEHLVLRTIAAFRCPVRGDTLVALLVGAGPLGSDEEGLEAALAELDDRGLAGWDGESDFYDLHPVVRGVVWSATAPDLRQDILNRQVDYLEARPQPTGPVQRLEDLAETIELFHTLIQLRRADDAVELMRDRLLDPMLHLGAAQETGELAQAFIRELGMPAIPDIDVELEPSDRYLMITVMALAFDLSGQPRRAADTFAHFTDLVVDGPVELRDGIAALSAVTLGRTGDLTAAEEHARAALATTCADLDEQPFALQALVCSLALRGREDQAGALLYDPRMAERFPYHGLALAELGRAALDRGDIAAARRRSAALDRIATAAGDLLSALRATLLRGTICAHLREDERADDLLHGALIRARHHRLHDTEADALVSLARWTEAAGRHDLARMYALDAIAVARTHGLALRHTDALTVLGRLDLGAGNVDQAGTIALEAYELCAGGGPGWGYATGIREAGAILAATGNAIPGAVICAAGPGLPPNGEPADALTVLDNALIQDRDQHTRTEPRSFAVMRQAALVGETDPAFLTGLQALIRTGATPAVRTLATVSLSRITAADADAGRHLIRLLGDTRPDVRVSALQAYDGPIDETVAAAVTTLVATDPEPTVRVAAITRAAECELPGPDSVIARALHDDPSSDVRVAAAHELVQLGSPGAMSLLHAAACNDTDPATRIGVLCALVGVEHRGMLLPRTATVGRRPDPGLGTFLLDRADADPSEAVRAEALLLAALAMPATQHLPIADLAIERLDDNPASDLVKIYIQVLQLCADASPVQLIGHLHEMLENAESTATAQAVATTLLRAGSAEDRTQVFLAALRPSLAPDPDAVAGACAGFLRWPAAHRTWSEGQQKLAPAGPLDHGTKTVLITALKGASEDRRRVAIWLLAAYGRGDVLEAAVRRDEPLLWERGTQEQLLAAIDAYPGVLDTALPPETVTALFDSLHHPTPVL